MMLKFTLPIVMIWMLAFAPNALADWDATYTREGHLLLGAANRYHAQHVPGGNHSTSPPQCARGNGNPFGVRLVVLPKIGPGDRGGYSPPGCVIYVGQGTWNAWKAHQARSGAQWVLADEACPLLIHEMHHQHLHGRIPGDDQHRFTVNDLDALKNHWACRDARNGWANMMVTGRLGWQ